MAIETTVKAAVYEKKLRARRKLLVKRQAARIAAYKRKFAAWKLELGRWLAKNGPSRAAATR